VELVGAVLVLPVQQHRKQLLQRQRTVELVEMLVDQVAVAVEAIQPLQHQPLFLVVPELHLIIQAPLLFMALVEMAAQVEPSQIAPARKEALTPVRVVAVQPQRALAVMLMVVLAVLVL
jgi:hypothetical protein